MPGDRRLNGEHFKFLMCIGFGQGNPKPPRARQFRHGQLIDQLKTVDATHDGVVRSKSVARKQDAEGEY